MPCPHHPTDCCQPAPLARRHFLRLGLIGGGAMVAGLPAGARAGTAEALLLSCMDYRLTDDTISYMSEHGLNGRYDHVSLAGASLAAVSNTLHWSETFWDHLDIAIKLHRVHKLIVLDHRNCGAYRMVYGKDLSGDEELAAHREQATKLRAAVKQRRPEITVETLLMDLDGTVRPL